MILRYIRTNGRVDPAEAESVELSDDGRISGWRTVSSSAVGSFAGTLPDTEVAAVKDLITAVADSTPSGEPPPPDAATESVETGGREAVSIAAVADHDRSDWGRLAAAARGLLGRMTDFPRAAVAVAPTNGHARLEHRGTEQLQLDLTSVELRVTAWRGYYEPAGDWTSSVAGPGLIDAGPGWSHDVEFDADFATEGPGITVHLRADFSVVTGGRSIPVAVSHIPEPASA